REGGGEPAKALRCESPHPAVAGPSETERRAPPRGPQRGGWERSGGEASRSDAGPVPGDRRARRFTQGMLRAAPSDSRGAACYSFPPRGRSAMLPLKDDNPTRIVPFITVSLIALNVGSSSGRSSCHPWRRRRPS